MKISQNLKGIFFYHMNVCNKKLKIYSQNNGKTFKQR